MDTRHLAAFTAVVDTGSFTRAAAVLHCSQPTVTSRIKALEQSLGTALFERLPSEVRLTPAGQTLVRYARDIMSLTLDAQSAISSNGAMSGRIDVGTVESVTSYRLLPVVEYLYRRYPSISLSMRASACGETISLVRQGKLHCAFFVDLPGDRPELEVRALCPEPLVLVGGAGHLLVGRANVTDDEVRSATLVRAESGANYHDQFERFLGLDIAQDRPRVLELDSIDVTKRSVAVGLGIALIPAIAVVDELAAGELCRIDWVPPFEVFTQVAWRRGTRSNALLSALLDGAEQVISEQLRELDEADAKSG